VRYKAFGFCFLLKFRIEDEDNPLKSIMLYLEEGQIKKLITLIEKVPDTVEEIKKNISKSDLFQ